MAQRKRWLLPLLFGVLFLSIACAIPSLPFLETAPESEPAPTIDPMALETMIANAAAEKVAQTLAAIPTNTLTPIPTETPTPSPTATEIPPTSTPTEVDYPETGSDLQEDDDGSITYLDYTGAYSANIPAEWLALRPGEAEYSAAWTMPEASTPEIRSSLEAMQSLDPSIFRIFILDLKEGHFNNGHVTNINFVLSLETEASLEEAFAQSVLELPDAIPGLVVTESEIAETSSGIHFGCIVSEWDTTTDAGQTIRVYQKQAIFMVKNRSLIITFTSTVDFKDQVLDDFETMVDEIELLD